ncbi:hypothetical protein TorRG33x02_091040 [Trema orientale]|uniref:KIB1-4 beta-propeller domain-containing protein n=1 Tax=Trema orientale TaxID=63057 RepID=A0A2P5FBP3_TREOI|nr:hypothetical protein TorRG33x02_091040 [Trema orientale]
MLRHRQVPVLLFPSEQEHTWSIYNIFDDEFSNLKLSLLYDKRFSGASEGWLLVSNKDYTVTLYRPSFISEGGISDANASINLPCLFPPEDAFDINDSPPEGFDLEEFQDIVEGYSHVIKALITGDPLINPNDSTIIVSYGEKHELACIRYGKDTTWRKIEGEHRGIQDMVYYMNQFYAVDFVGSLVSFDPCYGTIKLIAPPIEEVYHATIWRYLVESCGELLLVKRYISLLEGVRPRVTRKFRVFKFDFSSARWIEVKSLGDVALFVGDNSGISVLASNFNGCQANCIYFTHDFCGLRTETDRSCDIGVYSLESKSSKLFYDIDSSVSHRIYKRPPIWIVPLPRAY